MTDFLTIDGLRIAFTAAGDPSKPPILLLHGIMSHRGVWSRTIERLRPSFHCVCIDQAGFGESDKPHHGDFSIATQAKRALQMADHFGFEKFTIIGHSMGGQIATYLAANLAPGRVQKLVSVAGVVTGKLTGYVQTLTRRMVRIGAKFPPVYKLSRGLVEWKPLGCWMFKPWFYNAQAYPFDAWHLDRRMAMNPEIALSTDKAWTSLNATDLTPRLANITAPTLIIFGNQDGTVPVEQAHLFKEKLPGSQLVLFDACGHFPMYEKFDDYMASLQGFLTAS